MPQVFKAPFPYFGGKTRAAPLIWEALGDVPNLVEPFCGSLAVLLGRPHPPHIETVNDRDGFICNFWRAVQHDPDAVAHYADQPSNECDMHARHSWLTRQRATITARLEGDPDYYDTKIAGWWCWGICCWIGSGWCSSNGSWHVVGGQLVKAEEQGGISHKRPHLGNAGKGVQRQLPHLGDAGQGVQRQLPHLGGGVAHMGNGVHSLAARNDGLYTWMRALCDRLRYVRVTCGDWTRVLGPSVTYKHGTTGLVFDPPYSYDEERSVDLYAIDDGAVAHDVRAWCHGNGGNPLLRIVLCGYGTVHDSLLNDGWTKVAWKTNGGYGNQSNGQGSINKHREKLWFSPYCLPRQQLSLGL
jgi:DNA adenine methylase